MNTYENRRKSLPKETRENSRRMTENVYKFFVLPLLNTKKRDVKSLENGDEQRNTIRFSCVDRMFSVYFSCILHVLHVLVLTEPQNYRIIERILEFTGKKTTEKEWILTGKREKILGKCRIFES